MLKAIIISLINLSTMLSVSVCTQYNINIITRHNYSPCTLLRVSNLNLNYVIVMFINLVNQRHGRYIEALNLKLSPIIYIQPCLMEIDPEMHACTGNFIHIISTGIDRE